MPIIVGDTIHISQVFRVDGINAVVGANYELEDAGTTTTDSEIILSLINDNWTPTFIDGIWQAANLNTVEAVCVKVNKILPAVEPDFVILQNVLGGILVGDHLPSQFAAMVVKTSKSNGPGSTGRSFFPAPPEVHFPEGRLDAAGAILWNAVASFLNDVLTLGAFSTRWAPVHVQGATQTDVFRTWVSPNIRTVKSRQAIECPV